MIQLQLHQCALRNRLTNLLAAGLFTLFFVNDSVAQPRGPLATRKQFPTDLLFYSPAFEAADWDPGRAFRLSMQYTQANSFVKSGAILDVLPQTGSRLLFDRQLANALVQRDPHSDAYFFDLEAKRLSVRSEIRLSAKWRLILELPFVHLGGGFMDGIIEDFHARFGIPDDERPDFQKNTAQAFVFVKGGFLHKSRDELAGIGPGDLSLRATVQLRSETRRGPGIAMRTGIELPTGSRTKLHGNGSVDWGIGLLASKHVARNSLYLAGDALFPGAWQALPAMSPAPFFVVQLAYERLLGKAVSLLLQANSNSNPFIGQTDSGLNRWSHELTLGTQIDLNQRMRISVALSENYAYFRNSPDLGFQIGLALR